MANPVIEVGFDDLFETLGEFLADLSLHRLLLWAVVAAGLWALLRFRAPERAQLPAASAIAAGREALRDAMLVRCLIVFNALFAVQTALDAGYFWSGFALPDGMSYAGYAHRGAYPLVATTLLAIVFILTAFHDGREVEDDRQHRLAARLVYVWLAQNAFLLTSAAARLGVYVEAYQLTYFRIGAAIWMLLVGLGLAWTAVKLATGRSHAWLVDVNLATAAVILVLCCFPNYDRWIADYNVDQAISQDRRLDQHYLARLGPEALPALRRWWVAESWRVEYPDQADCVNRRLLRRVEEQEASWRGQTLRRRALHQRLDRSWGAHLPGRTSRSC